MLFLLLLLLFAGFLRFSWEAEKVSTVRELSTPLRFAEKYCDGYFSRIEKQHRLLGLDLLQQHGVVDADKAVIMLNNYKGINHDQRWFSLQSASGELIAETDISANERRPYFLSEMPVSLLSNKSLPEERIELEPAQGSLAEESLTLPLRYAVRDANGELKYLVRSRLRLGLLQDFWKTAVIPQKSVFGFLHHQGYLINRYSANPGAVPDDFFGKASTLALTRHLQSTGFPTGGSYVIENGKDGVDQLVAYQRLTYHPVTIFSAVPMSYVWARWWSSVRVPSFLVLALIVIGLSTYWLLVNQRYEKRRFIRKQAQLQDVAQGVIVAQEQERARISHELHDEIGQSLTALKITLNRAQQNLTNTERVEQSLASGQRMLEGLMNDVRAISHRLRPAEIDQLGLVAALRSHLDKAVRPLGQSVSLFENLGEVRLTPDLELCCFRVVQEALTNCLRHAKADTIVVSLIYEVPRLRLSIKDNGCGFDAARYYSSKKYTTSLGLVGMRERVVANGGVFQIRTVPEGGTEVVAIFDKLGEI